MPTIFCADDTNNAELQQQLEDTINGQLGNIDLGSFDEIISNLNEDGKNLFGTTSFWDKVTRLLNGDFGTDYGSFFGALLDTFLGGLVDFVPILIVKVFNMSIGF